MRHQAMYEELVELLNEALIPIDIEKQESFETLLDHIGEARIVLMGEASHGSEEFYRTRMALSKLLIERKGFHAIAIEGDWPSAYPVHRYIQGFEDKETEINALAAFNRFPDWMWRNTTLPPFLRWLRNYNDHLSTSSPKVGFYGLDLYSLYESTQAIIEYLKKHQPDAVQQATNRYSCFDHIAINPEMYGYLVNQRIKRTCIKEVTEQFLEMQHKSFNQFNQKQLPKNTLENDSLYYATQNARLVKNAEEYYRAMFEPRTVSWNIRDQHMAQTLSNLIAHIESTLNTPAKIIVWAHNSHVGDARATEMNDRGEINLGQIVREQYDTTSYLLGFSTYSGMVRAASAWNGESEIKEVRPALKGSYEALFHNTDTDNFFLNLRDESEELPETYPSGM